MNLWVTVKKLNERGKKKMLNAKLKRYLARSHAHLHEISALYIYIYIYICIDDYSFITSNH